MNVFSTSVDHNMLGNLHYGHCRTEGQHGILRHVARQTQIIGRIHSKDNSVMLSTAFLHIILTVNALMRMKYFKLTNTVMTVGLTTVPSKFKCRMKSFHIKLHTNLCTHNGISKITMRVNGKQINVTVHSTNVLNLKYKSLVQNKQYMCYAQIKLSAVTMIQYV